MCPSAERPATRPRRLPPAPGPTVDRAARLPCLVGSRRGTASALSSLSVAIAGCGSIGGRLALGLARLGVRALLLVDPARFKPESVLTHAITLDDVGDPKAGSVGQMVRSIHPACAVTVFEEPVEHLRDGDLMDADLLLMASDNLAMEVAVASRALRLGIPLLHASVDGATLVAQVRVVEPTADGDGPCLMCGYGPAEWAALDAGTRFACAGDHDPSPQPLRTAPPTRSPAPLCSLAADLALLDVLRRATGTGPTPVSRLIEHAGLVDRTTVTPLRRNPRCRASHDVPRRAGLLRPLADHSPAELRRAAGGLDAAVWSLAVDGHELAPSPACACPDSGAVVRFLPAIGAPPACTRCGVPLRAAPWERRGVIPGELLAHVDRVPLSQLGVADARVATVDTGTERILLGGPP